jgi:hypothetical protein
MSLILGNYVTISGLNSPRGGLWRVEISRAEQCLVRQSIEGADE